MTPLPPSLEERLAPYHRTRVEAGESGGTVHRLAAAGEPTLFLKHGKGRVAADVMDEAARLGWLAGRVAVPRVVHFTLADGQAWLVTEALAGRTIDDLLEDEPDTLPALIGPLAAALRAWHALPAEECPFDASAPVRLAAAQANMAAGRVDADDFGEEHRGWTAEQVWKRMAALRPATFDRAVTHGDFSLGNVLVTGNEIAGCIDVGRAGVADPYQDLAILWLNLEELGAGLGERLLDAYGAGAVDRERLAFHLCLDEFF